MKKAFFLLTMAAVVLWQGPVLAEGENQRSYTVTTYYPAPSGNYQDLTVGNQLTVSGQMALQGTQLQINPSQCWNSMDAGCVEDDRAPLLIKSNLGNGDAGILFQTNGLAGAFAIGVDASDGFFKIAGGAGADAVQLGRAGRSYVTVNRDNGNIGVGTDTPGVKLDVEGNIEAANVMAIHLAGAGGNITADRAISGQTVTATGQVSGATVTATGAISGATVTATGQVSGATIVATGQMQTPLLSVTGNTRIDGSVGIGGADIDPMNPLNVSGNANITGDVLVTGDVSATSFLYTSDQTLKENIRPIENALNKTLALQGVYFNFRANPGKERVGLIAQNVEQSLPQVVSTNVKGIKNVEYAPLVGLLIEAIKEQQRTISALQKRVERLEARP